MTICIASWQNCKLEWSICKQSVEMIGELANVHTPNFDHRGIHHHVTQNNKKNGGKNLLHNLKYSPKFSSKKQGIWWGLLKVSVGLEKINKHVVFWLGCYHPGDGHLEVTVHIQRGSSCRRTAPLPFRVHSQTISSDSLTRCLTLREMKSEDWIGVLGNIQCIENSFHK